MRRRSRAIGMTRATRARSPAWVAGSYPNPVASSALRSGTDVVIVALLALALFLGRWPAWAVVLVIVLAVLFFLGTVVVVLTPNVGLLVTGRVCLGLAVGGASTVVPVFLAELAPCC